MSKIFALIRHGDYHQPLGVPSALLPHPLTAKGESQAETLASTLTSDAEALGWTLDPTWESSVLLRAWQTTTLAAQAWSKLHPGASTPYIRSTDQLVERRVGSAANLRVDEISDILDKDPRYDRPAPGWKSVPSYRLPLPGAESLLEAGLRVAQHIRALGREKVRTFPEKTTLHIVVGHGASLRWAAHHLGVLGYDQALDSSMYHARPVYLERYEDDAWRHVHGKWKPRTRPPAEARD